MEGTSNSFAGLFFAVLSYFMLIKLVALLLLQLETNYVPTHWQSVMLLNSFNSNSWLQLVTSLLSFDMMHGWRAGRGKRWKSVGKAGKSYGARGRGTLSKAWNNFRCKFHFRCTHFLFTQNAQCRHMKHKRASVCRSCVYGNVRISVWKFVSPLGSECVLMSFKLWRQISWGSLYLLYASKIIIE